LVNFYQTTRCYNPEDSNLHCKCASLQSDYMWVVRFVSQHSHWNVWNHFVAFVVAGGDFLASVVWRYLQSKADSRLQLLWNSTTCRTLCCQIRFPETGDWLVQQLALCLRISRSRKLYLPTALFFPATKILFNTSTTASIICTPPDIIRVANQDMRGTCRMNESWEMHTQF
jgi:hypothetical protein